MKTSSRLPVVLAGAFILYGCGQETEPLPPMPTVDLVFEISKAPPLPDGRPVIDIRPNGVPLPAGTGPSGSFFLMVRRNGVAYYTRWFGQNGEAKALQRDLAMPTRELQTDDKLTVSVENIFERDGTKYIRLSNILDLSLPPASAPSSAIRIPQVVR
jgi:hypothetical protein